LIIFFCTLAGLIYGFALTIIWWITIDHLRR
jgi:hypothetical protein